MSISICFKCCLRATSVEGLKILITYQDGEDNEMTSKSSMRKYFVCSIKNPHLGDCRTSLSIGVTF